MGGQRHAPTTVPLRKTQYPLYRRLGDPPSRSGRVRKFSTLLGFDPRTVKPVASRYTDRAIPAPIYIYIYICIYTYIRVYNIYALCCCIFFNISAIKYSDINRKY